MPTTRETVASIHRRNPKYSPQEILEFLNEVYYRSLTQEIDAFIYKDPATGMVPFIQTQAGVFTYNCPANCRKTAKIAVGTQSDIDYLKQYFSYSQIRSVEGDIFVWCGKQFFKLSFVHQEDAVVSAGQVATVSFGGEYDPGTNVNRYYHFYWTIPNQLTSLDSKIKLPDELHFMMRRAVSAYMSTEDYGESNTDEQMIEKFIKDVRRKLDKGASGRASRVEIKAEDRDF